MNHHWAYSRSLLRLRIRHHRELNALHLKQAHEKADLYTAYRTEYARLETEMGRAFLLKELTQQVLDLKYLHQQRRQALLLRQHEEKMTLKKTVYSYKVAVALPFL